MAHLTVGRPAQIFLYLFTCKWSGSQRNRILGNESTFAPIEYLGNIILYMVITLGKPGCSKEKYYKSEL